MNTFQPGLVHTPVTPFARDHSVNYRMFGRLIEFHLANGADALALPMHAGESVSLSDEEQRKLLEFAIRKVKGRIPVIAHASDCGTAIAADRARHAERVGAAAVVATTPYYWTPPQSMLIEHLAAIGGAVRIPFYVYNSPEEMAGTRVSTDLALKLIERLENFAGVVDLSLDWQFMIELLDQARRVRPDFQLLAGVEYAVSAAAIGATGVFSPLASIAPRLVRSLFDQCRADKLFEARKAQEDVAALRQIVKKGVPAALKSAMRAMGRNVGEVRPPLQTLAARERKQLTAALGTFAPLAAEPRGW
jgi:4-hydroxy-tetrahydrodipicolinate synthase